MQKYVSILLVAALSSATMCGIAQTATPKVKLVPIQPTSAVSGQEMYRAYCAACHGVDGTGHGPAVPALKTPPGDLATLSVRNGGTFPWSHVQAVLKFEVETPAHGSADMPVWGQLFSTLPPGNNIVVLADQRINNLLNYLKQIQWTVQ